MARCRRLRPEKIESQAETVYKLALTYEFFRNDYDETSVNQETRVVEIHQPDGKPNILQQIEHGVLSIVSSYESMGRLYRGIQEVSLQQYVILGDVSTVTDNLVYKENEKDPLLGRSLPKDDRLVFTEKNPQRELYVAQVLAAASRVLRTYNPELDEKCLRISEELYKSNSSIKAMEKINAAAELYLTTSKNEYKTVLLTNRNLLSDSVERFSEVVGRITAKINDRKFTEKIEIGVARAFKEIAELAKRKSLRSSL